MEKDDRHLIPVTDLEFSVRAHNHLANLNIQTVGQLIQWSAADIASSRGLTRKNIAEFRS